MGYKFELGLAQSRFSTYNPYLKINLVYIMKVYKHRLLVLGLTKISID